MLRGQPESSRRCAATTSEACCRTTARQGSDRDHSPRRAPTCQLRRTSSRRRRRQEHPTVAHQTDRGRAQGIEHRRHHYAPRPLTPRRGAMPKPGLRFESRRRPAHTAHGRARCPAARVRVRNRQRSRPVRACQVRGTYDRFRRQTTAYEKCQPARRTPPGSTPRSPERPLQVSRDQCIELDTFGTAAELGLRCSRCCRRSKRPSASVNERAKARRQSPLYAR